MKTIAAIILMFALAGCMTPMYRGDAIRNRLADTPGLATHNISIDEERAGIVTLNGNVSSDKDRNTIENVARETSGVKEVRSNLIVEPSHVVVREGSTPSSSDQGGIASEIVSKISSTPELKNYSINVGVAGGAVTLRGEVGSESERAMAEYLARNTSGVTGVRNEIILVSSARSDLSISQSVRESLLRRTDIDISSVEITTRDAIVTLRGSQYTTRDIDNVVSVARSVPGVRAVQNELRLAGRRYSERYR